MSQTERSVDTALKDMLVNNEPFQYAHLIKFERPSLPDSSLGGRVSTSAERYVYITDGSININFDDGSVDLNGNANGTQTYIANKVKSIGTIREETRATASQTSLTLDGNVLGAYLSATVAITNPAADTWDIEFLNNVYLDDVLSQGFREGDKVSVSGIEVNIHSFRSGNKMRVTKIDTSLSTTAGVVKEFTIASEEIISILLNKNDVNYASFINREVFIYRAYIQDGSIVGQPINLFKGIIQNVSFEDSDKGVLVTWGLTSHWGDFAAVRGRVTSDEFHRALDENGIPQVASALKPIYAYDKGFIHAENSINVLAKYTVMVEDIKVKSKSGFFGLFAKTKVKKQLNPEDRFADLDFQLAAKAIPIIYGVRVVEGIPVFADVLNDDSSTVYIVTVLSEGEIGGLYDVYIDNNSLVCVDEADYDARGDGVTRTSEASDAIDMFCRGRADRGDVLDGTVATDNVYTGILYNGVSFDPSIIDFDYYNAILNNNTTGYTTPEVSTSSSTTGIIDGQSITLTSPQDITIDLFTGSPGQKASAQLTQIAAAGNFKIQNDYWNGSDTAEYWGPNHRLLDTAYVTQKFKIVEGDTTIPEIKYVVRGKIIDCYNYDYSYIHDSYSVSESASNFVLGEVVDLYDSSDVLINSSVQIIDKWTFKNPDGTDNVRFRFDEVPDLDYSTTGLPAKTKFYMKDSLNNTWTMLAHNHVRLSGAPQSQITTAFSSIGGSAGNPLIINYSSNSYIAINDDVVEDTTKLVFTDSSGNRLTTGGFTGLAIILGTSISSTSITTVFPYDSYSQYSSEMSGTYISSANTIRLPSGASGDYTGDRVRLTRVDATTGKSLVQEANIIGYDNTSKVATIDDIWIFTPKTTDTVEILPKYADKRVSINPAIQTLDYVTSKTYGRGLDVNKDINLSSWTETARKCDKQADVSVCIASGTASATAIYKYPSSGNIIWQGELSYTQSTSLGEIFTFTNVLGKLTNKWNSWKSYALNEIIYHEGNRYLITSAGVKSSAPTHTTGTVNGMQYTTTLDLTKVSGTGSATLSLSTEANPVFNARNNSKISGYSTYDCDSIRYWRMCGWDEHAQRYATQYQTNIGLSTSSTLFDNTNTMLDHFNGIIRYTSGQYYLDIEEVLEQISLSDIRTITTDDIIGKIQLNDEGTRSAFNSLTAAYADPAIKFEARNVSFFNSDYLKIDRNVPKKGNLSIPGITNYYNTRLLANTFLNKSRFGLTISMRVRYHGILFLAGTGIQVIYPRYGSQWESPGKLFRIENLNYLEDGLVDIVATEYDPGFYDTNSVRGVVPSFGGERSVDTVIGAPSDLVVTSADSLDELYNGVELTWVNNSTLVNNPNVATEIFGGQCPNLFLYITAVDAATNTFLAYETYPSTGAHDLVVGMPVFAEETYGSLLESGKIYYVESTPGVNTFTLSATRGGAPIDITSSDTGLNITLRTAALLETVPVPINTYSDNIPNPGSNRVEKYYWIRHVVTKVT